MQGQGWKGPSAKLAEDADALATAADSARWSAEKSVSQKSVDGAQSAWDSEDCLVPREKSRVTSPVPRQSRTNSRLSRESRPVQRPFQQKPKVLKLTDDDILCLYCAAREEACREADWRGTELVRPGDQAAGGGQGYDCPPVPPAGQRMAQMQDTAEYVATLNWALHQPSVAAQVLVGTDVSSQQSCCLLSQDPVVPRRAPPEFVSACNAFAAPGNLEDQPEGQTHHL